MDENTMTSMENDGPRKKNQKVAVAYVNAEGASKIPQEDCGGLHVLVKDASGENLVDRVVMFSKLPKPILTRALAFGLNTLARNCVNTALTIEEGAEAFVERFDGFENNVWRTTGEGTGSGITDVIQAMINAVTEAGWPAEKIEAKKAEWIEHYAGLTKENKKKQNQAWLSKIQVKAAYDKLVAEKAAERARKLKEAAKASGKTKGEGDDLADL